MKYILIFYCLGMTVVFGMTASEEPKLPHKIVDSILTLCHLAGTFFIYWLHWGR